MPIAVCRRRGLYQASIHSKIAAPSSSGVSQIRWSRSSRCMVDQNDSIIELSTEEATRPMDPSSPASRSRCPNTQDVDSAVAVMDQAGDVLAGALPGPQAHVEGIQR